MNVIVHVPATAGAAPVSHLYSNGETAAQILTAENGVRLEERLPAGAVPHPLRTYTAGSHVVPIDAEYNVIRAPGPPGPHSYAHACAEAAEVFS
jgi:hypothetical protein